MHDKIKRLKEVIILSALVCLAVGIVILLKTSLGIGIECPFKKLLNWDCPGCGATRMAVSMLQLKFYQAFRYNPFIFVTAPILLVVYIWQAVVYIKDNRILKHLDAFLITYVIAIIIFGIIRNIEQFRFLAPTCV